jgi:hypothetical protein
LTANYLQSLEEQYYLTALRHHWHFQTFFLYTQHYPSHQGPLMTRIVARPGSESQAGRRPGGRRRPFLTSCPGMAGRHRGTATDSLGPGPEPGVCKSESRFTRSRGFPGGGPDSGATGGPPGGRALTTAGSHGAGPAIGRGLRLSRAAQCTNDTCIPVPGPAGDSEPRLPPGHCLDESEVGPAGPWPGPRTPETQHNHHEAPSR